MQSVELCPAAVEVALRTQAVIGGRQKWLIRFRLLAFGFVLANFVVRVGSWLGRWCPGGGL